MTKKSILILSFFVFLMLAACAGPVAEQPAANTTQSSDLIVYRSPT